MNVVVLGEVCDDIYIYGECTRINPEAPTQVFVPNGKQKITSGMAGNTFLNLVAMRPSWNIKLVNPYGCNITKTRFVDEKSNYILLRVDDKENNIHPWDIEIFYDSFKNKRIDAVVISDYNKGFLTNNQICDLTQWCRRYKILTFLDTKKQITNEWASYVDFIKINEKEYTASLNREGVCGGYVKNGCNLIVTTGKNGCEILALNGGKTQIKVLPEHTVEVRDVSGCGDTFHSAFAAYILDNKDNIAEQTIVDACKYANKAASIAVSKSGVVVVTQEEINKI